MAIGTSNVWIDAVWSNNRSDSPSPAKRSQAASQTARAVSTSSTAHNANSALPFWLRNEMLMPRPSRLLAAMNQHRRETRREALTPASRYDLHKDYPR